MSTMPTSLFERVAALEEWQRITINDWLAGVERREREARAARSAASENKNSEGDGEAACRVDSMDTAGHSPGHAGIDRPGSPEKHVRFVPSPSVSPTPRAPMPTRGDMAGTLLADWVERGGFNEYGLADAALSLIAPHVAALEATARQAEEENARLRERVAELERPGATLSEWGALTAERDAALARAEKAEADLEEARKVCAKWEVAYPEMVKIAMSKPPSASAGTGTISDDHLAQDLLDVLGMRWSELSETLGHGQWTSRGKAREMARRAKELLGGSNA